MDAEQDNASSALGKIRDTGLLLSLATAYLCEAPFLRRFGREMALNVEKLGGEIDLLRKQFPGRFLQEVNTDDLLSRLNRHAEQMQNPDQQTMTRCGQGELGRALEADVSALLTAVHAVRAQVEGKPVAYGRKEAFSAVLESGAPALSGFVRRILKGFVLLVLVAALAFGYLFFTMQKEAPLVEDMKGMESQLHSQEKILAQLEREKAALNEKMRVFEGRALSAGEKIQLLELGVQIRGVEAKQRDLETDIAARSRRLRNQQEKIEKMQSKSFLERLLRR